MQQEGQNYQSSEDPVDVEAAVDPKGERYEPPGFDTDPDAASLREALEEAEDLPDAEDYGQDGPEADKPVEVVQGEYVDGPQDVQPDRDYKSPNPNVDEDEED